METGAGCGETRVAPEAAAVVLGVDPATASVVASGWRRPGEVVTNSDFVSVS